VHRLGFVARLAIVTIVAARAVAASEAFAALLPFLAFGLLVGGFGFAGFRQLVIVVVIRIVVAIAARLRILVLEPRAAFAQNAEIMVRELEILFGLDAVAGELGVARHALIFFEQLGGIAALPVVLAVPRLSAEILAPLSPTAATAAALSIVDQMPTSSRSSCSPFWPSGRQGGAWRHL
jgi:hypothetical protein